MHSVNLLVHSRNENKRGREIVEKLAFRTKSTLPENWEAEITSEAEEKTEKVMTIIDVIKCPPLLRTALVMGYVFVAVTIAYYGYWVGTRGFYFQNFCEL